MIKNYLRLNKLIKLFKLIIGKNLLKRLGIRQLRKFDKILKISLITIETIIDQEI